MSSISTSILVFNQKLANSLFYGISLLKIKRTYAQNVNTINVLHSR